MLQHAQKKLNINEEFTYSLVVARSIFQ